jgi:glycogen synthase
MNILSINQTDITQIGGVNYSIRRVSEELAKRGHECSVISINPGNLPDEETINGVRVIRVRSQMAKYAYGLSPSVGRFLKRHLGRSLKPDIAHIHQFRSVLTLQTAHLLSVKRLPFVFSPHYDRLGYNTLAGRYLIGFYKPFGSLAFKWAKKTVVNSEYTKGILAEDFKLDWRKVEVIPHGVNYLQVLRYRPEGAANRPINLLYVGVLTEKKGVHHLIRVLSELDKLGRQAKLTIVGGGDRENELRNLAKTLHLEGRISWHKPLFGDQLRLTYKQADMLILLSRDESYGIVVAEALAAGTPCIVTKTTALTEFVVEPGCFGVEYPPNPKEVADVIVKIHDHGTRVGPFSDRIVTWDRVAASYEQLYEDLLRHVQGEETTKR